MKKQLITLVALLVVPAMTFAQTADEIVSKNIAALGGADKIAAVKSVQYNQSMNVMGMDMTGKTTVVVGKSYRSDMSVMGQQISQAFDGDKGWAINPMNGGSGAQPMTDEQVKALKGNAGIMGADLAMAKDKKYTVELVGKDKLDGKDVYNLKVTRPDGSANYFVDATNYQLASMKTTANVQGQTGDVKVKYGEYKTVDGLILPTKLELENPAMPGPLTMTLSDIKLNPTVDPSLFAMPK